MAGLLTTNLRIPCIVPQQLLTLRLVQGSIWLGRSWGITLKEEVVPQFRMLQL